MAVLGWTEACWLAKDHLSPAEARFVITEGAQALSATLAETSDADHGVLGIEVARTLGWMLKDLGLAEDACAAFQMAVALGERLDNPRQLAWSARDLGCWYRDAHDFARARQWLTSAIGGFRALGDERQLAISLKDLGLLELEEASGSSPPCDDRLQAARSALQAALSLAEMLGDTDLAAWVNRYLGLAEAGGGELEEGRQRIERTAEQFWHFRDTNVALSQFCAQHVGQIRRPILVERFGHSHEADADFRGLLE
jgi:tetratricopeptide (TPR) repeat protein